MTAAANWVFIDTNILIYAYDNTEGKKHYTAKTLVADLWRQGTGLLSTQVLQEFYNVATRKLKPPISRARARKLVADYSNWVSMNTDTQLLVSASMLEENHSLQWWDALIIEAALRSGATTLLSEDMRDGRRFGMLTVRNPFVESN